MNNKPSRFIALIISMAILLSYESAYAMNKDYLDYDKWGGNPNVTFTEINSNALDYALSGTLGYYVDSSSMCIYTLFIVDESSIDKDNKDIRTLYEINTSGETYFLELDGNGLTDNTPPRERELFSGASRLYAKENCIISAAEYLGKEGVINVKVNLYVNGHIHKNLKEFRIERPTTTKKPTTTKAKTTKAKSQNTANNKTKSNKEKTTKFVPKGKVKTSSASGKSKYIASAGGTTKASGKETTSYKNEDIYNEGEEFGINANAQLPLTAQMSRPSLILLLLAVILATAGITLLITASVLKKNKKQDEENNEE